MSEKRPDFEQALGESFAECATPPLPFEEASAHECCEVVWQVVGFDVTPAILAAMEDAQIAELSAAFGLYFETTAPSVEQMKTAISRTLARWPVRSLGET
jgi:hypothetical protein